MGLCLFFGCIFKEGIAEGTSAVRAGFKPALTQFKWIQIKSCYCFFQLFKWIILMQ